MRFDRFPVTVVFHTVGEPIGVVSVRPLVKITLTLHYLWGGCHL